MRGHKEPIKHSLYLVRHGQCIGNVTGQNLPPDENVITELGEKQADALGEHLQNVEFTKAFASNYQRAHETAKRILAKSLKPCATLKSDPDIREREFHGTYGMSKEEIDEIAKGGERNGIKYCQLDVPGCESQVEFVKRIRRFFTELFEDLKSSSKPETVLVASHSLTIQRFLHGTGANEEFSDFITAPEFSVHFDKINRRIPNTAYTHLTVSFIPDEEKPYITFHEIYSTQHLANIMPPK